MPREIERSDSEHGPLTRRVFTTTGRARPAPPVSHRPQPAVMPPTPPVVHAVPVIPEPVVQAVEPAPLEEAPVLTVPDQPKRKASKKTTRAMSLVLLAAIVGGGLWFTSRGNEPTEPAVLAAQTVEEVAAITTDEKPIILYVTDKTKVQQEFLSKAENGDEVWLYYQAKKAVLYRPSSDEVISVGEFTPPPAKVFIRNGTTGSGVSTKVEAKLKTLTQFNIVSKDRSSNTKYPDTIVVDISGRYSAEAQTLATELGATLGDLPKGETRPDADILVIVGAR